MSTGLLSNQIGYDPRYPLRWVFRSEDKTMLDSESRWKLVNLDSGKCISGIWKKWGKLWKEHWWIVEIQKEIPSGEYFFKTTDVSGNTWTESVNVEEGIYFKRTWKIVALNQFERRAFFSTVKGHGWIDCGGHLSETNPHAVAVYGMAMMYQKRRHEMEAEDVQRLLKQIRVGCEFFLFLAQEAIKRNLPDGTYQHEPINASQWILNDCLQVGIALCVCAGIFRDLDELGFSEQLIFQAQKTYHFLNQEKNQIIVKMMEQLEPIPEDSGVELRHFEPRTHALPDGTANPSAWMTRELLLLLQFQLSLHPYHPLKETEMADTVERILDRWCESDDSSSVNDEPIGYFLPFPDSTQPEVGWCHHSVGRDTGGVFPHWLVPLWEWTEQQPNHEFALRSRTIVEKFFGSYVSEILIANPFSLLPNTWKQKEGWLYFAGTWHGMNATYALMAMQCFYFAEKLEMPWLKDIGKAQLDWIAGLNVGLTKENLKGCHCFEADIPEGEAVSASMIHGIGKRYAGSWRNINGSICNGFARGKQFFFDVPPLVTEDYPDSFTDEDWITHSGAWLAALAYSDL